jgi:hypothetical protein
MSRRYGKLNQRRHAIFLAVGQKFEQVEAVVKCNAD